MLKSLLVAGMLVFGTVDVLAQSYESPADVKFQTDLLQLDELAYITDPDDIAALKLWVEKVEGVSAKDMPWDAVQFWTGLSPNQVLLVIYDHGCNIQTTMYPKSQYDLLIADVFGTVDKIKKSAL